MSAKDARIDNRTGEQYHLGSYGVPRLGVDNANRVHYYDEANDRMLVKKPDSSVREVPLNGRPVVDWVAFIADPEEDTPGWKTHGSSQMLDALAGAI